MIVDLSLKEGDGISSSSGSSCSTPTPARSCIRCTMSGFRRAGAAGAKGYVSKQQPGRPCCRRFAACWPAR